MENKIRNELQKLYHTGDRVTNKELKKQIQLIYDRLGYKTKAKGTDIKLYGYSTHKVKIRIGDKRLDGVELTIIWIMKQKLIPRGEKQVKPMDVISPNCKIEYLEIMKNHKKNK